MDPKNLGKHKRDLIENNKKEKKEEIIHGDLSKKNKENSILASNIYSIHANSQFNQEEFRNMNKKKNTINKEIKEFHTLNYNSNSINKPQKFKRNKKPINNNKNNNNKNNVKSVDSVNSNKEKTWSDYFYSFFW